MKDISTVCGRYVIVLLGIMFIGSLIFSTTFEVLAGITPTPTYALTPTATLTPVPITTPKSTPTRESPDAGPTLTPVAKKALTPIPTPVVLLPASGESSARMARRGLIVTGIVLVIAGFLLRQAFSCIRI